MDSAQRQEEHSLLTCYSQEVRLQGPNAPSTYANLKTLYRNYLSASLTANDLETLNSNYLRAAKHLAAPYLAPESYTPLSIIHTAVANCKKMYEDDTAMSKCIMTELEKQYQLACSIVRDTIERKELDREYSIQWDSVVNGPDAEAFNERRMRRDAERQLQSLSKPMVATKL